MKGVGGRLVMSVEAGSAVAKSVAVASVAAVAGVGYLVSVADSRGAVVATMTAVVTTVTT